MPKVQPKTDKFTEFVKKLGPSLYKKLAQRGVQNVDSVYDNMMRQLAYESMYGTSRVAREQHNYGGYGWNGKTYTTFDSDDAFLDHYLDIMTGRHKDSLLAADPRAFATALKKSGYYEDSVDNYTRNLAGMQSLSRAARSHRLSNPELYSDTAEPIVQPDPIIARPDKVVVRPVIPEEQTLKTPYGKFRDTLPPNQRNTPEFMYRTNRMWELGGKPKDFGEAIGRGLYNFDFSDNMWHANSVVLNQDTGEYEFLKPNYHDTKVFEDAWYYSKDGEDFRDQYTKQPGIIYDKYVPRNIKVGFKDGKLPGFGAGKTNATVNKDGTFVDDTTRLFDDFYVTPSGVKTKYGSYTDKNWDRYKKEQKFLQYRDANGHLRGEPGLEIVSPEFDLITAVTGLKPGLKTIEKSIQATADRGGFTVSTPYLGDKIGKITAWIPTDRSPLKGISYIATGRGGDAGVPINYIKSAVSGEGRKLYDAAIKDALNRGYKGIITGKELISAPKTYSTLEHYWPNRTKLGDFGTWSNKGMVPNQEQRQNTVFDLQDFLKAVSENPNQKTTFIGAPVYRLEQPSRKYKNGKLPGFYKGTGPANQESSSTTIYNAVRSMPWQGYWNKAKQIAKDAVSFWPGIGGGYNLSPRNRLYV